MFSILHYSHSVVVSLLFMCYFWVFIQLIIFKNSNSWDPGICKQRLIIIQHWKGEMIHLTAGDSCIKRVRQGNLNFPPSYNTTILMPNIQFNFHWVFVTVKSLNQKRWKASEMFLSDLLEAPPTCTWTFRPVLTWQQPFNTWVSTKQQGVTIRTADRFDQRHGRLRRIKVMRWKSNEGRDGAAMPAQHRVPIRRH